GVQFQAPAPGLFTATVRGLSSSPSNNSFEQTVGLFVDGIFAGHPRDYTAALFDIDHVELLKGTQAAVLGKNTSVGAISLSTKRPDKDFGYEASFIQEFALDSQIANAAVNVPLTDNLSVRVAGIYSNQGGWIRYRLLGDERYPTRTRGLRLSLRWTPTDRIDWTVYAQASDNKVTGNTLVAGGDTLGRLKNAAAFLGYPDLHIGGYSNDETGRPGY
ncbi:MAG: TonB-dependent receptor plug domain-containing protein, partial [Rhodospirillales bacterium]|nr:TonB-dependent receptor plug domain-containing protein [Rhodospirillales bacterium]